LRHPAEVFPFGCEETAEGLNIDGVAKAMLLLLRKPDGLRKPPFRQRTAF